MDVSFYLQGEVVPANYDHDMDLEGILIPTVRHVAREKGRWAIVLQRGKKVPTIAQRRAIRSMVAEHPDWKINFYFQQMFKPPKELKWSSPPDW
jgi:hypothetical protein